MNVFTYGSLMFPQVWQHVVRACYRSLPARLYGYARFAVRDASYPGILAVPDAVVDGVLYLGLGADDLERLDAFEGSEYRRQDVAVQTAQRVLPAATYVYLLPDRLAAHEWDPGHFDSAAFLGGDARRP